MAYTVESISFSASSYTFVTDYSPNLCEDAVLVFVNFEDNNIPDNIIDYVSVSGPGKPALKNGPVPGTVLCVLSNYLSKGVIRVYSNEDTSIKAELNLRKLYRDPEEGYDFVCYTTVKPGTRFVLHTSGMYARTAEEQSMSFHTDSSLITLDDVVFTMDTDRRTTYTAVFTAGNTPGTAIVTNTSDFPKIDKRKWVVKIGDDSDYVPVAGVTISPTRIDNLAVSTGYAVATATVTPANATYPEVHFHVPMSGKIITERISGLSTKVTAFAAGYSRLIAEDCDGNDWRWIPVYSIIATDLNVVISKTSLSMRIGNEETLQATIVEEGNEHVAEGSEVTWSSSNSNVASVDSSGKITAISSGTATIKATLAADSSKYDICTVTVSPDDTPDDPDTPDTPDTPDVPDTPSTSGVDTIIRIDYINGQFQMKKLYEGNLKFDVNYPIETLGIYEAESVQKVYWVDGKNQPRMINIMEDSINYIDTSFDFLPTLQLNERVEIEKIFNHGGLFPSGVIQYALTYSNEFGQESAIFYSSPLLYLTEEVKGSAADAIPNCSFRIKVTNPDKHFQKINVYSIIRTSLEGTVTTRLATQLEITNENTIEFVDNNTSGETVDNTSLLYKGGEYLSAYTLDQKDNTLFLGNIKLLREPIENTLKEDIKKGVTISFNSGEVPLTRDEDYFEYSFELNSTPSYMRSNEVYRYGIQFQDERGKWTSPVYLDDKSTTLKPYIDTDINVVNVPRVQYSLDSQLKQTLANKGYKKYRMVVVYPTEGERSCIAQGVLNPTVFSLSSRYKNSAFSQSSWFFRPINDKLVEWPTADSPSTNVVLMPDEWRNMHLLPSAKSIFGEIQVQENIGKLDNNNIPIEKYWATVETESDLDYNSTKNIGVGNLNDFAVDTSIVTLNSPDLEDTTRNYYDDLKLRIVGLLPLQYSRRWGKYDLQTSTPAAGSIVNPAFGFYNPEYSEFPNLNNKYSLRNWGAYIDHTAMINYPTDGLDNPNKGLAIAVYPWQRTGAINGTITTEDGEATSVLKLKRLSNKIDIDPDRQLFFDTPWLADTGSGKGIGEVNILRQDNAGICKLPLPLNSNYLSKYKDLTYLGEADTTIFPNYTTSSLYFWAEPGDVYTQDSGVVSGVQLQEIGLLKNKNYGMWLRGSGNTLPDDRYTALRNPVRMQYKSTTHAVFAFNNTAAHKLYSLPIPASFINSNYKGVANPDNIVDTNLAVGRPFFMSEDSTGPFAFDKYIEYPTYDPVDMSRYRDGFFWIGELYRDIDESTLFGGKSDYAIENNKWVPCSPATNLNNMAESNEGDTFFQKWDCLKTYAYNSDAENSVTEILSFYVETHKNIDGRYDRNRNSLDNTYMTPLNFNLMNTVYNQRNNFFNYRVLSDEFYKNNIFPNQITWSATKSYGEPIDSWTNIPLISTLDLDGDKGKISAIRRWNNTLLAFQDKGISEIIFNPRVQINPTDGVPIELATSGKVEGKRYISNIVGCLNKWSIATMKSGIFFVDDLNESINILGGAIRDLSEEKGFKVWTEKYTSTNIWNPKDAKNFRSFYNPNTREVYLVNKETCLCFSEYMNQFTSFYSYEDVPAMFSVQDIDLSIKNGYLWQQRAGEYSNFYDNLQDYYIQYKINPTPYSDKTFTNLEYRADMFNNDNLTDKSFDTLEVWNAYQHGENELKYKKAQVSNLKKKFRIWRTDIPRDTKEDRRGFNRMRNPWINLKLKVSKGNYSKYKMEFHDLLVKYYE